MKTDVQYVQYSPQTSMRAAFFIGTILSCGLAIPFWAVYEIVQAFKKSPKRPA